MMPTASDFENMNALYTQVQEYLSKNVGEEAELSTDEVRMLARYNSALFLAVETLADLLNYQAFVEGQGEPVAEDAAEAE